MAEKQGTITESRLLPMGEEPTAGTSPGTSPGNSDSLAGEILFRGLRLLNGKGQLRNVLLQLAEEFPTQDAGLRAVAVLLQLQGSAAASKAAVTRAGGSKGGSADNNGRKGGS